jgi:4a-hydroxytetrahydrobiopterin dehydratase
MNAFSCEELTSKKCAACEGGVEKYTPQQAEEQLQLLPQWRLSGDGQRIRRDWQAKNFQAGMDFLNQVARLAEQEGHHPDLHLEGYRHVWIELWTHAIGGLSENDFILAAKIERLPIVAAGIPRPVSLVGAAQPKLQAADD